MTVVYLALLPLAVVALVRTWLTDEAFAERVEAARAWRELGGWRWFFGKLLTCPPCLSLHTSLLLLVGLEYVPAVIGPLIVALAISLAATPWLPDGEP